MLFRSSPYDTTIDQFEEAYALHRPDIISETTTVYNLSLDSAGANQEFIQTLQDLGIDTTGIAEVPALSKAEGTIRFDQETGALRGLTVTETTVDSSGFTMTKYLMTLNEMNPFELEEPEDAVDMGELLNGLGDIFGDLLGA